MIDHDALTALIGALIAGLHRFVFLLHRITDVLEVGPTNSTTVSTASTTDGSWIVLSALAAMVSAGATVGVAYIALVQLRGLRSDARDERDARKRELQTLRDQLDASNSQNEGIVTAMVRPMVAVQWARVSSDGQLLAPLKNIGVGPALRIAAHGWIEPRSPSGAETGDSATEIVGTIGQRLRDAGSPHWELVSGAVGIGESVQHWHRHPGTSLPRLVRGREAVFAWTVDYFDVDDRHYRAEGEDGFKIGMDPPKHNPTVV